jgi:hypothetical protein
MTSTVRFCARPHEKTVDFRTSRFVVGKACGINTSAGHLAMGDEVPSGILSEIALRQLYNAYTAFPGLIETVESALNNPDPVVREACARRGVVLENKMQPAEEVERMPVASSALDGLEELNRKQLAQLCGKYDLEASGNRAELIARLKASLA